MYPIIQRISERYGKAMFITVITKARHSALS